MGKVKPTPDDDTAEMSSPTYEDLGPRAARHKNVRAVDEDVSVITCRDGTGLRYVTDIRFDASQGLPFSWHAADAMMVRKPGVVDDLARALKRAWPTMAFSVQHQRRRVVR